MIQCAQCARDLSRDAYCLSPVKGFIPAMFDQRLVVDLMIAGQTKGPYLCVYGPTRPWSECAQKWSAAANAALSPRDRIIEKTILVCLYSALGVSLIFLAVGFMLG